MSTMLRPERALSRVQMARDTSFFTNRVKERGVRSAANVDLRDLEALALAKKLHALTIIFILASQGLLNRVELDQASHYRGI